MAIYCFVVLAVTFACKFRQLRKRRGNPGVTALCCTILLAALTFWMAYDTTMAQVDRVIGTPNAWALVYYGLSTTAAVSGLGLALFWRYPARVAWSRLRWIILAYALVITVHTVLFTLSSVPEEHLCIDFLLTYASQPMPAAFLLSHSVPGFLALAGLAFWCFSWSRESDYSRLPWLRRGLRLYAAAFACDGMLCLEETVVVAVKVSGSDVLDPVSRVAPLIASVAFTTLLTAALVVPMAGTRLPVLRPWLSRWRAFFRLLPLHRELRHVAPDAVLVASGRLLDPHHRLRRVVIELNDWRLILAPLYSPAVAEAAERRGREAGLRGRRLEAAVEAAQLRASSQVWRSGVRTVPQPQEHEFREEPLRNGTGIAPEVAWWTRVARAFRRSPW